MKEREYQPADILIPLFSIAAITLVSQGAFSRRSRRQILERDGYACKVCGATDCLEAAHINHSRDYKNYDDPSNGYTLCTEHHLEDHINRHGRNGLTKRQNNWAINMIMKRLGMTE